MAVLIVLGFGSWEPGETLGGQPDDSGKVVAGQEQPSSRNSTGQERPQSITNSIGMKLVLIPAGEFMMGSGESAEETAAFFKKAYGDDLLKVDKSQRRVCVHGSGGFIPAECFRALRYAWKCLSVVCGSV
ncbi:MAG: hypothetical protein ACLQNE_00040 [Thermoguttaceae bacterium]